MLKFFRGRLNCMGCVGRSLALVIFLAALSGCATNTTYPYDDAWRDQASTFRIIDQRPEVEKTPEIMSLSLQSERYGEYRLGDAQLVPERIAYIRGQLLANSAGQFDGKTAYLKHFEIFNKLGSAHRNAAANFAFSAAAASAGIPDGGPGVLSGSADGTPVAQWPRIELFVEMELNGITYSSTQRIPYHGLNKNTNMRYPAQALKVAMRDAAQDIATKAMNN